MYTNEVKLVTNLFTGNMNFPREIKRVHQNDTCGPGSRNLPMTFL